MILQIGESTAANYCIVRLQWHEEGVLAVDIHESNVWLLFHEMLRKSGTRPEENVPMCASICRIGELFVARCVAARLPSHPGKCGLQAQFGQRRIVANHHLFPSQTYTGHRRPNARMPTFPHVLGFRTGRHALRARKIHKLRHKLPLWRRRQIQMASSYFFSPAEPCYSLISDIKDPFLLLSVRQPRFSRSGFICFNNEVVGPDAGGAILVGSRSPIGTVPVGVICPGFCRILQAVSLQRSCFPPAACSITEIRIQLARPR